jgi:flagellar hook-associated protein 2
MDGLTGIASGVDTSEIVTKLMAVEQQKRDRMDLTKAAQTARGTNLGTVQTKLLALRNAAAGLRDVGTWADTQTIESSSTSVTATRTGGAGPGGYSVNVLALARAEQRTYTFTASSSASTLTAGGKTYNLAAGASLDDAVAAINGTADSTVYAVNVNNKLVLSSRSTGTTSAFTASGSQLSGEVVKPGTDASFTVDGGAVQTSKTNQVTSAIPGVTLTLKGITPNDPAAITVGAPGVDKDAVKTKAQAFVDAYNDLVKTTKGFLEEKKVVGATTAADAAKGSLYGDTGLTSMLSQLRQGVSNLVGGGSLSRTMDELREFGISTGDATGGSSDEDAKAGLLKLDADKLTAALDANPLAVRTMLGGVSGTDGFAQRIETMVKSYTGATGSLTARLKQSDSALKDLQDQMTAEDTRLSAVQTRLKAQFAAMETALGTAQSQQAWLTGQIAQLG